MQAQATALTAAADRRRARFTTLVVMAVTAAVIFAVAYLVNQPAAATAGGVTPVTVPGVSSGPIVGKAAPDFTATTSDGQTIKLSSFIGKPVWITFGASWCQPCRAENPDVEATYLKHRDRVTVIQVYMTESASAVKDYADRVGLDYLKVPDPDSRLSAEYGILGIPSHFFIDATGVLRQLKVGSLDPASMETYLKGIGG